MHEIISFSGGRSSAFMVLEVLKRNPNAEVIYADTGAEHPATYRFIKDFARVTGIKITCLRGVVPEGVASRRGKKRKWGVQILTPDDLCFDLSMLKDMKRYYANGNNSLTMVHHRGCLASSRLKIYTMERYLNKKYGKGNYVRWLGIRADEPKRLKPKEGVKYLADISSKTKEEITEWWSKQPFDLHLPGDFAGNCVFCPKKNYRKLQTMAKIEPDLLIAWLKVVGDDKCYRENQSLTEVLERDENSC